MMHSMCFIRRNQDSKLSIRMGKHQRTNAVRQLITHDIDLTSVKVVIGALPAAYFSLPQNKKMRVT